MSGTGIAVLLILAYLAHTLAFYLRVRKEKQAHIDHDAERTSQRTQMSSFTHDQQRSKGAAS
jgi:hypothetical protein